MTQFFSQMMKYFCCKIKRKNKYYLHQHINFGRYKNFPIFDKVILDMRKIDSSKIFEIILDKNEEFKKTIKKLEIKTCSPEENTTNSTKSNDEKKEIEYRIVDDILNGIPLNNELIEEIRNFTHGEKLYVLNCLCNANHEYNHCLEFAAE